MIEKPRPRIPGLLAFPLKFFPDRLHSLVMARLLTQVFRAEIAEGELDFLLGQSVQVIVTDGNSSFAVRFESNAFIASNPDGAHLTITGSLYDYLLLISGREDPDTLFFQRHLSMEGDTGLGVHLKNFLSSVDPASLPLPLQIQPALQRCLRVYERLA